MFDTLLHNFIFLATHLVIDAQIITKVDANSMCDDTEHAFDRII